MKRRNILFGVLLSAVLGLAALAAVPSATAAQAATASVNRTLRVQSGYKTGFFAEISNFNKRLGATVEFDLYDTNFKKTDYVKSYDVSAVSGTSGSLASVSFVFGKTDQYPYTTDPATPAWHISNDDLSELNFGGFQYFCNGVIRECTYQGNFRIIKSILGDPSGFMEDGYSYKVSLRYDTFEYDGTAYGDGSPWFYVERKGIFDDPSAYKMLFAYKKAAFAASGFTNGKFAGMEFQGLCKNGNVTGPAASADGKGHSLIAEIDNLRIYDGTSYDSAAKKSTEDFESVTDASIALPDMNGTAATINTFGKNRYLALPSKMRCISANFGQAMGTSEDVVCRLQTVQRNLFTVTFKDSATGEVVSTQKTYTGLDFRSTRLLSADGSKVYKFDYSGIDFDTVNGDVEVSGSPVSYFTLRVVGGVTGVNDKSLRVNALDGKYKITADLLVREDYDLLGFAREKDGDVVYPAGSWLNMENGDKTVYAVWSMKRFTTSYRVGGKVADTVVAFPREIPLYRGSTPLKEGYAFAGWDATVGPANVDATVNAQFVKIDDVNAQNKALSFTGAFSLLRTVTETCSKVTVKLDVLKFPAGSVFSLTGAQVDEAIEEGYAYKADINAQGAITLYKAFIGSQEYSSVGTYQATSGTVIDLRFDGNGEEILLDDLSLSYDGKNEYLEDFNGVSEIAAGIYHNYYTVTGNAQIVPFAKNVTVTFKDTTTDREIAVFHTYKGGNVALVPAQKGVDGAIAWNKTQSELLNIQSDITVTAALTWETYTVNFIVTPVLGYKDVQKTFPAVTGIYGQEIALPTLVEGNYGIIGWTTRQNGNLAQYADSFVFADTSVTLYSVWGGKPVTVGFYADDGETLLETQTVEYLGTAVYGGATPEKEGYTFVGWDGETRGLIKDTKLVARFEKIKKTVSVSVHGGAGTGLYTEGDTVTLSGTSWKVTQGNVQLEQRDGDTVFTVGDEDVVIEAVSKKSKGCKSTIGQNAAFVFVPVVCFVLLSVALLLRRIKQR